MAKFVWTGAYCSIAAVNLSSCVKSMRVEDSFDTPDATAGGDVTHLTIAGGLRTFRVEVDFFQDHASSL